ncbi:hypothetical protein HNR23_003783 [Nocardiopsis mwathae]|uniref:Uncharacterized protein n=1 Tax=Nocardiopsis mwathae TaxID=1472723 RepID=A0A7W9YKA0_9ACTN|nr:hypothetical protein [Nocardiopsis mwathae]MBB6173723.1 hypothetical protein [Nocardiopsis mwathae]
MSDEKPYAVVTVADVFAEVRAMSGQLSAIGTQLAAMERRVADLEQRADATDRWRYALPISTLSALVAAVAAVLTAVLS